MVAEAAALPAPDACGWATESMKDEPEETAAMSVMPAMTSVASMSSTDRMAEALRRSKSHFGPEVGQMIDALLTPTNLAIMAGTLALWAGSHLVGIGEIVDVLLLVVGAFTIGWSITDVARGLYDFADLTINGKSAADLDRAAAAFAKAVTLAGITIILAVLLRKSVKQIQATRGTSVAQAIKPRNPGLPKVGADPAKGRIWSKPGIKSDPSLSASEGSTSAFGEVRLSPHGSVTEQALVRAHELVHQFLTPRFGILRTFRVQLGMSGYLRSLLLQYLEEALAETVAQLRVNGLAGALTGVKFPVANGYMTLNALMSELGAIGTVTAGTQVFSVAFIPNEGDPDASNVCR